jgi:putative hemolysin
MPSRVSRAVESAGCLNTAAEFVRVLLDSLDIGFEIDGGDLNHLPAKEPLLVVANHPFGFVEGLVLIALLDRVRPDSKILANAVLASVPAPREKLILVNTFESKTARRENLLPLRQAFGWLKGGGLLAIFPGGEVASLNWMEDAVTDPPWKTTAARLALRVKCPVLPIFFTGTNSMPFHLAATLHPMLRTLSLALKRSAVAAN